MKVFNQKALDKTNTKAARKKRKGAKAFGDKVMGRVHKKPIAYVKRCKKDDAACMLRDTASQFGSFVKTFKVRKFKKVGKVTKKKSGAHRYHDSLDPAHA